MWEDVRYKKIDRIIALLTQLQSKRILKAQILAERFDVSIRTIYRDIETLQAAGVPIIGEAGTGYSIMEGYRLPPVIFSKEEAISFLAAEKMLQQYMNNTLYEYYTTALTKIKAVLKWTEKDLLDRLDAQMTIVPNTSNVPNTLPTTMENTLDAIGHGRKILIHYKKPSDELPMERIVEPIGVFLENNHWYLIAFCELRIDYRQFRLDRVLYIKDCGEVSGRVHKPLNEFITSINSNRNKTNKERVSIRIPSYWEPYTQPERNYYGFEKVIHEEDSSILHFNIDESDLNYLARWYLMYADRASIVQSEKFNQVFQALLQEINLKHLSTK